MEPIVSMTGRLGTDVELRTSRNGTPYSTFRMASSSRQLRDGQWVDGPTTWISVRCYRGLGENAFFSLRKGHPVLVNGRLRTDVWTDPSGGQRERIVLEAVSVGHDLNWGIGTLRRPAQPGSPTAEESTVSEYAAEQGETERDDSGHENDAPTNFPSADSTSADSTAGDPTSADSTASASASGAAAETGVNRAEGPATTSESDPGARAAQTRRKGAVRAAA